MFKSHEPLIYKIFGYRRYPMTAERANEILRKWKELIK